MKARLNLRKVKAVDLHQIATNVLTAMTGNPVFPNPTPGLATIAATLARAQARNTEADELYQQWRAKRAECREADAELTGLLQALVSYVQSASGGDEAAILSAAMSVFAPRVAIGSLPAPGRVRTRPNGSETSCLVEWSPIYGAASYVVECATDPTGDWRVVAVSVRAEAEITGLASGTRYYFRVRAIGAAGDGPWSDIASKIIGA